MYNFALNSLICGHLLAAWAIVLNILGGNKLGVLCAIGALAIAYFNDGMRGYRGYGIASSLPATMALLVASYLLWLFY